MKPFVHLHNHSEYSLLDGIAPMRAIVERVRELGMDSYALTDHGVMYGVIPFFEACRDAGIKPIIGCEVYLAKRGLLDKDPKLDRHSYHLTLLAKNLDGYRNLMRLVSLAHCKGMFYKPRVDKEALSAHRDGLICLSGCLNGPVAGAFLTDGEAAARKELEDLASIFDSDFYVEIQRHGIEEQDRARDYLIDKARAMGLPLVATNDCHYVNKNDADAHDIALCIGTKAKLADADRLRYDVPEFYIKSTEEMAELFSAVPEALEIATEIASRCNLELPLGKVVFPAFDIPEGRKEKTHAELLRALVYEGAAKRYGEPVPKHICDRLDNELAVIEETGYSTYFLIVWDFIRFARSKNIAVGPGRGSGAGSCVAYCLEITDVDPIRFNLLFERFLNKDRVSLPDFDIDFCMERRDEVIEYVKEKYGRDNVAQIVTFNHLKAKAVIKAVGRVMDLPFQYVNEVTKKIPWGLNVTIEDAIKDSPDLVKMMEDDPLVKKMVEDASKLEGLASHPGVHAAGIVIAYGKLEDFVPVQMSNETELRVAQYDLSVIEKAGLVKMDFLGLRTLTMLEEAVNLVREFEGVEIDLRKLPLDDEKTYRLFQKGDTVGVFQFERAAVRRILRESLPATIEDISTINGLNRPGPSAYTKQYIQNRRNPENAQYVIPEIKEVLDETAGIVIYQEQVMEAARRLAGFSLGQADILRWAMGKKKHSVMEEQKAKFIAGATANGLSTKKAEEYFHLIETFAGYGFNKCHSLPYSVVSYYTAYLKAHYPRHFITALINSFLGSAEFTSKYIREAQRMGIAILPPDVNASEGKFRPEGDGIRFGLAGIKGVGKSAIGAIVTERAKKPFASIADFIFRVDTRAVTRAVIEALIKAGALDAFDPDRGKLLSDLDRLCDRSNDPRQAGLFGDAEPVDIVSPIIRTTFTKAEISELEREVLGVYLSGHPLEGCPVLEDPNLMSPSSFLEWLGDNLEVVGRQHTIEIGGVLSEINQMSTKDGRPFARAKLIDTEGSIGILVFNKQLGKVRDFLVERNQVVVKGQVKLDDYNMEDENDIEALLAGAVVMVADMKPYESRPGAAGNGNGDIDLEYGEAGEPPNPVPDDSNGHAPVERRIARLVGGDPDGAIVIEYPVEALKIADFHEFTEDLTRGGGHSKIVIRIMRGDTAIRELPMPGHVRADRRRIEQLERKYRFRTK